jgi:hypothetical protein
MVGCASLESFSVARSDRLDRAPFYVTYDHAVIAGAVLVLPVTLDDTAQKEFGSGGRIEAIAPLLNAINDALKRHPCCLYGADDLLPRDAPKLYVGSLDGEHAPTGTGIEHASHEEYAPMIVHLEKPGPAWKSAMARLADQVGADRIVVPRLSFTQFPKADRGLFGKKVVLGTNYEVDTRLLSAVDKPVEVIALTGLVLNAEGDPLRAGAEGIISEDAAFWIQMLGLGKDVTPETIQRLVAGERRNDLPEKPLKWEAALDQLLQQLLKSS